MPLNFDISAKLQSEVYYCKYKNFIRFYGSVIYADKNLILLFVHRKNKDNIKVFYLEKIKAEMKQEWPKNRTINLVFHGHSVPAGYFKTPIVNTLASYPYLVLQQIKLQINKF